MSGLCGSELDTCKHIEFQAGPAEEHDAKAALPAAISLHFPSCTCVTTAPAACTSTPESTVRRS